MLECSCGAQQQGLMPKVKAANSKQEGMQTEQGRTEGSPLGWHFARVGFCFIVLGMEPGPCAMALSYSSEF